MADIVDIAARRTDRVAPADDDRCGQSRGVAPVTSLALVLRNAPELHPEQVTFALLASGSNAAASPIWAERKQRLINLLTRQHRLSVPDALAVMTEWRAAVTTFSTAEKARRRRERDANARAAKQFFDDMGRETSA